MKSPTAQAFGALAHDGRMNMLVLLSTRSRSVTEMAHSLGSTMVAVSLQLKVLLTNRLVIYEQRGHTHMYSLTALGRAAVKMVPQMTAAIEKPT